MSVDKGFTSAFGGTFGVVAGLFVIFVIVPMLGMVGCLGCVAMLASQDGSPRATLPRSDVSPPAQIESSATPGGGDEKEMEPTERPTPEKLEPIIGDGFELHFVSASIDHVSVQDFSGRSRRSQEPALMLQLRVANSDDRRILRYRPDTFLRSSFTLHDDVNNRIRGVGYGLTSQVEGALTATDDIMPGESAGHVEVFAVPPPRTEYLTLTVDLGAFGGRGEGTFVVPMSLVHDAAAPQVESQGEAEAIAEAEPVEVNDASNAETTDRDPEDTQPQYRTYADVEVESAHPADSRPMREWTSGDGQFTVSASLVSFGAGVVKLRREDGREIDVPMERLSEEDQDHLRELMRQR